MDLMCERGEPLPVYVLIGGQSRRFGVDKAAYRVDGEPWALHVANRLASATAPVVLVGSRPPGEVFSGAASIPDSPKAPGPLGGVIAALVDRERRLGSGLLCLASCDLVRPEPAWLDPLLAGFAAESGLDGAAYRDPSGWQPFPSILHTRWTPRLLETAPERVASLQDAFRAARILDRPWPSPGDGPPQANTPEALQRLLAAL